VLHRPRGTMPSHPDRSPNARYNPTPDVHRGTLAALEAGYHALAGSRETLARSRALLADLDTELARLRAALARPGAGPSPLVAPAP
jgi:hypothetical protein